MTGREVDIIKQKIDIVDFIKSYLTLTPAGRNFKALCPFHSEKTPSFIVSPERQRWHCFGACGEGGDVIKFLMKYENLEFPEALKILAERAGVELKTLSPREQREFGVLYELNEQAKNFYRRELAKNKEALDYLKARSIKPETIEEFELGFASGGETLALQLLKAGYDISDVVRAGLASKGQSGLHRDHFQGRIMFPIMNNVGKVVAFTGRVLRDADNMPKYLNSPETLIFNKSKILYGFHKTKNEIAKSREVFLVEGQMDLLASWQAGVKNAVAVSGTGLTRAHLERLRRAADTVMISFDSDEAGLTALERALETLSEFDFHVKAVDLGGFSDPAEVVAKDEKRLHEMIKEAKPAFRLLIQKVFSSAGDAVLTERKKLVRRFLLKIKKLPSSVERDEWLRELSRATGISTVSLERELGTVAGPAQGFAVSRGQSLPSAGRDRIEVITERMIALVFQNEKFRREFDKMKEWIPESARAVLENPDSDAATFHDLGASYAERSDEESLEKEFENLAKQLKIETLKRKRDDLREEIRKIRAGGDGKSLAETTAAFYEVTKQIDELKK